MKFLIETFFNTECGPVLNLDIARGLQQNGVDVYVIISEQMENLEVWKKAFPSENLYICF